MGKESKKSTSKQEGKERAGRYAGCKCVPRKEEDTRMWPTRHKPLMQESPTIGVLTECRERAAQRSRRGGGSLWRRVAGATCRQSGCCQNIPNHVPMTQQVHILYQGSHNHEVTFKYSECSSQRENLEIQRIQSLQGPRERAVRWALSSLNSESSDCHDRLRRPSACHAPPTSTRIRADPRL